MTETYRVLRLLGRRLAASQLYEVDDAEADTLRVHLADADILIFVDAAPDGQVKYALSYLTPHKSMVSTHLNHWARTPGRRTVPLLVADLWHAFWAQEMENRALGRVQWMHGPDLPFLDEDVAVQLDFFEESPRDEVLAANVEDTYDALLELSSDVVPGVPQKKLIVDVEVLDIFG